VVEPALYVADGERFLPTDYTAGPWSPELQHAGPPSALLAHTMLAPKNKGTVPLCFGRFTADILRPIPIAPLTVETRVLRPGRKVQLLGATLRLAEDGTELMRATAWRLERRPLEGAPDPEPPPRAPEDCPAATLPWWEQEIAYHAALEWRLASGTIDGPGPACVWTRLKVPLIAGEAPTPLERLLVMADAASGVSWELEWSGYTFPNVDFSVHLEREPEGEWVAMDAVTRPGPLGAGQATSVLFDGGGRVGVSTQTLAIAER
jgi:hypothetical protein